MRTLAALLLVAVSVAPAAAQTPPGNEDVIARYLYPPEKILSHAEEISLTESQRKAIREEVHKAQGRFLDLQFEMQPEGEKIVRLLQERPVEEPRVLAQVDRVLALEREIKRTHLSLLMRIRNVLTLAQQDRLAELEKTTRR